MLKRLTNKARSIIDKVIGSLHLFLEKKGAIGSISYTFYKRINNAVSVNHKYPLNFKDKDKALFDHYTGYETGSEEVFEVKNVNVSDAGVIFKSFNNFGFALPHPVFRQTYGWRYMFSQRLFKKKKIISTKKKYVLIYDFWAIGNYYHWLIDTLPRLWIMRDELKQQAYSLLLPSDSPKFVRATLSYFEILDITYIDSDSYLFVNDLLVPNYAAGSGHIHPARVREMRGVFISKILATSSKQRIYVSRSKQKARRVINEKEIIEMLLQFDFKIIYFEEMTFEEQVAIAKGAEIMITSHGANLTNCMFMPDGAKVLELIRDDEPNFCYWALCNAVNLNYYYQLCRVGESDHLIVDLELFKLNLQRIIND